MNEEDIEDILFLFDEEEEDLLLSCFSEFEDIPGNKRNTVKDYLQIIETYTDKEFLSHFRLNREKTQEVTERFSRCNIYLNLLKNENSRANISPEKHIFVFLWFAGHQTASYRDVADRFDLSLSSLHDIITRVSVFLSNLASEIITLPNEVRKRQTMEFYDANKSFPNVIGSIDGTHIKIDKPTERSIDYCNRKDYYSIVLQGVCDEQLNFTDIFIGYPGSVHDARVFRNSTLFDKLRTVCDEGQHILGDSAYPLLPQLLTPYRDNGRLTQMQKHYNKKLSSCRVSIEHTFGLLKERFRQLYHLNLRGHARICHFIRACCVLHNIASKEDAHLFNNEEHAADIQPEHNEIRNIPGHVGVDVRDEICRQLFERRG